MRAAKLVAARLKSVGVAEPVVWDEGVFSLNQGYLESLLGMLNKFDFAALIWGPDDITDAEGTSKASPRDNVVFECGLFMGALGRERVFIIRDSSLPMRIPSDLEGVTLAEYDGARIGTDEEEAAVRPACDRITCEIERPRFPTVVGEWKSRYILAADPEHSVVTDDVEIQAARGGVTIQSKNPLLVDNYSGFGRIIHDTQIIGEWSYRNNQARGAFLLTVDPLGSVMYGYATALTEHGATVYNPWILARARANAVNSRTINEKLRLGEESLFETTLRLPPLLKRETLRGLSKEWLVAIQSVYYPTRKWHIQKVRFEPSERELKFRTLKDPKKLQWEWSPRLENGEYLIGPWKTLRPGGKSHGCIAVQLSSNRAYMFGHDYGAVDKYKDLNFGMFLAGATQEALQDAWEAASAAFRQILPLSETADAPELAAPAAVKSRSSHSNA